MRKVQLEVAGLKLTLKSDADAAYVEALGQYVEDKIAEAKQGARVVSSQAVAVLAALNIADDLFKARRREDDLRRRVRARSRALLELLERAPSHTEADGERQPPR